MADPETDEIIAEALRTARDTAFDAAIEICQDLYRMGGCAQCCATAIGNLKRSINEHLDGVTALAELTDQKAH